MFSLKLLWTGTGLVLCLASFAAGGYLGLEAWRRSHARKAVGWVEALRLLIVGCVSFTLLQPEFLEQAQPTEKPTIAVLYDVSDSMATEDVYVGSGANSKLQSRSDFLSPMVQPKWWQSLNDRFDFALEPFSSPTPQGKQGTNLHAALASAMEKHDYLRGIVLCSDGDWNLGDPPALAATSLRARQIPVFSLVVGSEFRQPDVSIDRFDVPSFGVTGKKLRIPIRVQSSLPRDELFSVTLSTQEGVQQSKPMNIAAMNSSEEVFEWLPQEPGDYLLKVVVPTHPDEKNTENNDREVKITIRNETLKVLLIESTPRWEYRYLRNALERDPGVDVACLLFHPGLNKPGAGRGYLTAFPATQEELSKFDVVFLGDVGAIAGQLTPEQCQAIRGLVQNQASGLIFMPGRQGNQFSLMDTALEELYPVVLDSKQPRGWGNGNPSRFELTESGRQSLLTRLDDQDDANSTIWETLPGFHWHAPVSRAKAGSQVLAIHGSEITPTGLIPLIVTKPFGTGKILFMGSDNAWRWREGVEDKYHYRFWGQVARWMAYQRNMAKGDLVRLFYSPDRPSEGSPVTLYVNAASKTGEPLENGHVNVTLRSPDGNTETIRLRAVAKEWGLFSGEFTPKEHGAFTALVRCEENDSQLTSTLTVAGLAREKQGEPVRSDVLAEISRITGGKVTEPGKIHELLGFLADLPEPEPLIRRFRLWCHPLWIAFLVLLLGLFWTLRKVVGTV